MRLTKLILLFVLSVFIGCSKSKTTNKNISNLQPKTIIDFKVDKDSLKLIPEKGQWFYKNLPFNGFATLKHKNGAIAEAIGYYNGKKEGVGKKFFDSGELKKQMFYIQNKLDGKSFGYFKDGSFSTESSYKYGKRHGVQRLWYINGQLAKQKNLIEGKEEGMQQAWLENGKIYVNYEAKNGRKFGLSRANLCYRLKEEKVQYAKKK